MIYVYVCTNAECTEFNIQKESQALWNDPVLCGECGEAVDFSEELTLTKNGVTAMPTQVVVVRENPITRASAARAAARAAEEENRSSM